MIIKQISVFLENKSGRINDVAKALAANNINMQAFSMAETTDFGILRRFVSDVDKAVDVQRNANFAVILTDVVCISCPIVPGALSKILESLAKKDIFIEYMYAFSEGKTANTVIRPNDLNRCIEVLRADHCNIISNSDF